MPRPGDPPQDEIAILTQAVENILRKIIRYLIGKMTLLKLQELIRTVYVEEAENYIKLSQPQRSVSLTKLGILCGLDTRTLIKIRNSNSFRKPFHVSSSFFKEFTPSIALMDTWNSVPPYFDPIRKRPNTLQISGGSRSFLSLFNETVKSRGITPNSLLNQLTENGAAIVNPKAGTVELARAFFLPLASDDQLEAIAVGFAAIGNHVDTVVHNLESGQKDSEPFYQRGVWSYKIPLSKQSAARKELRKTLEKCDSSARKVLRKYEDPNPGAEQLTAGISLFYFEESE